MPTVRTVNCRAIGPPGSRAAAGAKRSLPAPIDTRPAAGHNLRFPGGVPEWLKGADCKSVGLRLRWFESNLLHQISASESRGPLRSAGAGPNPGGCSSMAEQKPSKLMTRVRFPSPAPANFGRHRNSEGVPERSGGIAVFRVSAHVAQW